MTHFIAMTLQSFGAVVLAGGRGSRLNGVDKASIEIGGRTLLARALDALIDASEVVVVGATVPTERPVTFVREDPAYGGPVAGLLTGRDALLRSFPLLAVLAVDMPRVTAHTMRRLQDAAEGRDGAALTDPGGRRQLALMVRPDRLDAVRPPREEQHGASMRSLLAPLDLAAVPARSDEHRDVDTWVDLRELGDT